MMNQASPSTPHARYPLPAVVLHWLTALLIVAALILGFWMTSMEGLTPAKLRYFSYHKWIGVTVFALALLRMAWRAAYRAPPLPQSMPNWQRAAAHAVHALLYLLMLAVPITGYLYSSASGFQVIYFGVVPLPTFIEPDPTLKVWFRTLHVTLVYVLLAVASVHLLAVLKHQLIDRDGLLKRMLPSL